MIIDTHAHLNHLLFNDDRESVIKRCLMNNISVINVGTNFQTSKEVISLAQENRDLYATIGLHPMNLKMDILSKKYIDSNEDKMEDFDYEAYKEIANAKEVVAIGEIGLDYYWKPKTTYKKQIFKEKQKELLLKQLKLAQELDLPVIFHCRMANQDLIQILKNSQFTPKKAVIHSFVGTLDELKEYLNLGFYIGFNAIIFKELEGINFNQIIRNTSLNRILVETDSPYLSPPDTGIKRNEPIFIKHTLKKITEIKNLDLHELSEQTTQNAKQLFNI